MLERIKIGDRWLNSFVRIAIIVLMAVSLIAFISIMSSEGELGLAILPVIGGLVLCASLYLNYFIAGLFYLVACDKGYDGVVYIRVPYFLGFAGYILVCALPDKSCLKAEDSDDDLPEL